MVTVTDYYGKPFEYDVEKYSDERMRRVVKVDEDGNQYNSYADYHLYNDNTYIHINSVLKDVFGCDGYYREFMNIASKSQFYLLDKLNEASADYLGWRVPYGPFYLSPQEFVDKLDEAASRNGVGNNVSMTCFRMCYDVDKSAVAYNQYPSNLLKFIIYTAALVVRKTPPYLAEKVSHSSDLYYHLNRWGLTNNLNIKHFFEKLDIEIEKRK